MDEIIEFLERKLSEEHRECNPSIIRKVTDLPVEVSLDILNKLKELILSNENFRNIVLHDDIIKQNTIYLIYGVYQDTKSVKFIYGDEKEDILVASRLCILYDHCIQEIFNNKSISSLVLMYSRIILEQIIKN